MGQKKTLFDIYKALTNDEFVYYYQPIISLVTGKICHAEALLRWKRPYGSLLMPASFIPLAEDKGFISEITKEMYPKLIDDLDIISVADDTISVSLNLSTGDLKIINLAENISTLLAEKGVSPSMLTVEIVEDVIMPLDPVIANTISEFVTNGISIVLNDFTAGHTSLNYLSKLPLSALKVNMDIVRKMPESRKDFRILRHLVGMSHQLDLDIIAEGIETQEMYDLVLSVGCTAAQGYYFSKPIPLMEFVKLLKQQPEWLNYPFGIGYLAQIDHIDFRRDVIREAMTIYTHKDDNSIRQKALARLPMLEAEDCFLCKWYSNEWVEHDTMEVKQLLSNHEKVHETAKELLNRASEDSCTWNDLAQLINRTAEYTRELIQMLQLFAEEEILRHYKGIEEL